MKFIMGEDWLTWLSRATYRGTIGLFYETTWGGILAYSIFAIVCVLAIIGLFTIIKALFHRKKKEDPGEKWLRTGKF
jgi:uncharacterized membrane protein